MVELVNMSFPSLSLKQRKTAFTRRMMSTAATQAAKKIEASLKEKVTR